MRALISNLFAGVRLAVAAPVELRHFRCSVDQVVFLCAIAIVLSLGYSAWAYGSSEYLAYSLGQEAFHVLLLFFFGYLLSKITYRSELVCELPVVMLSLTPLAFLILAGLTWATRADVPTNPWTWWMAVMGVYVFWSAVVCLRGLKIASGLHAARLVPICFLYLIVSWLPAISSYSSSSSLWFGTNTDEKASTTSSRKGWQEGEDVIYAQTDLLDRELGELLPERPGVTDLYFVGFAGYGHQDVFMKEVLYARELMDDRFDTRGRSVVLINNKNTLDDFPLASRTSLRRTLNRLGSVLNPEEDILFLFLTSHGSSDHRLSVSYSPLPLNDLSATDLSALVRESRIRWKVVVVSACYSGGFLDKLKDDQTLVITASARDQRSFGCSDDAPITDFGKALFQEELSHQLSFVSAFEGAAQLVHEWETRANRTPSLPQISAPAPIQEKLRALQTRLERDLQLAP